MAYRRAVRYEPGQALMACSICGMTYRWPSELHYADDKLYYCTRTCWLGKTALQDQREQAASMRRKDDDTSRMVGPPPMWAVAAAVEPTPEPDADLVVPPMLMYSASAGGTGVAIASDSFGIVAVPAGQLILVTVFMDNAAIISGFSCPGLTFTVVSSQIGSGVHAPGAYVYAARPVTDFAGGTIAVTYLGTDVNHPRPTATIITECVFSGVSDEAPLDGLVGSSSTHNGGSFPAGGDGSAVFGLVCGDSMGAITPGAGYEEIDEQTSGAFCAQVQVNLNSPEVVAWTWANSVRTTVGWVVLPGMVAPPLAITNLIAAEGDGTPSLGMTYTVATPPPVDVAAGRTLLCSVLLRQGALTGVTGGGLTWSQFTHADSGSPGPSSNHRLSLWTAVTTEAVSLADLTLTFGAQPIDVILAVEQVTGAGAVADGDGGSGSASSSTNGGGADFTDRGLGMIFSALGVNQTVTGVTPGAGLSGLTSHDVGSVLLATSGAAGVDFNDGWTWTTASPFASIVMYLGDA